jgi:hypothetical protein
VDANLTSNAAKIVGAVIVFLCFLGILGAWSMREATNPYGAVHIVGMLTLDGEPVAGASVILHPRDRDAGRVAGGITDSQGRLMVTTGTSPMAGGAVPGEYDVTFQKIEAEGVVPTMEELRLAPAAPLSRAASPRSVQPSSKKYVIPQKYGNPKTSGQFIIVESKGGNNFSFALSTADP